MGALDLDGVPMRIVGTMTDVTETRALGERAATPLPVPPSGGRVLVVDDDPLVGRSLARLLRASCDVTVLTSPAEAIARIEAGVRWDAILCDLMMPELSGIDFDERLVRSAPDLVPRVVYLTGGAFTERARQFLAAGRPFLEKPVEAGALRARVNEIVSRARR